MTTVAAPAVDHGAAPVWRLRRTRSSRLLLVAMVLAVLGALLGLYVYRAAVDRDAVIAVARPVADGSIVTVADLREVELPDDSGLAVVPWTDVDTVIGRFAVTDLLPGQIVTADSVTADRVPRSGEAVVGLSVAPGRVPSSVLAPHDTVLVITDTGEPSIRAQVVRAGEPALDGRRDVDVLVPEADAAQLSAASATDHVSVVLVGR